MANRLGELSQLSAKTSGAFSLANASDLGVSRKRIAALRRDGVIERLLPQTYRMTSVPHSNEQWLHAALLWAGDDAVADGHSAGEVYRAEGVRAPKPEIAVGDSRARSSLVVTHRVTDRAALMVRQHRGFPVAGPEATLLSLANSLAGEAFEIACEDLRRRRLVTVPSLRAYLDRFGLNRPGAAPMRSLLAELDPVNPSRSTLEVKTRRLLVANGITDFVREFPLTWKGTTYFFDFARIRDRTILETNDLLAELRATVTAGAAAR